MLTDTAVPLPCMVLDTNIVLSDPKAIYAFPNSEIVLPIYVLEEMDKFKKESNEIGLNARLTARMLDDLREKGSLATGIDLGNGSILKVTCEKMDLPSTVGEMQSYDERILGVAYYEKFNKFQDNPKDVTMVSNDINVRLRADSIGLKAISYKKDKTSSVNIYEETKVIDVSPSDIELFYANKFIEAGEQDLYHNQYVILKSLANSKSTGIARFDKVKSEFRAIAALPKDGIWGIRPRNLQQSCALDALMDDNIKLVALSGIAGGGKSLVAAAAGLQKVMEDGAYQKVTVARPIVTFHAELGFMPGTLDDKLLPFMAPIFDTFETLMTGSSAKTNIKSKSQDKERSYMELVDLGVLNVEAISFIRGKTLSKQFIILDECQNMSPLEMRTILSRIGEGAKVVLCGDPSQIDVKSLDTENNGLSYVISKFLGQSLFAHISMPKGERSALANLAVNLLT